MTYEFKVGDAGLTLGGQPYRVICVDRTHISTPVVALVRKDADYEAIQTYDKHGKYLDDDHPHDLLPPIVKLWYPDDSGEWVEHTPGTFPPVATSVRMWVVYDAERESQEYTAHGAYPADIWEWSRVLAYKIEKEQQ